MEQYLDEHETRIRGSTDKQRIADDKAVASDLLNVLP
jgi:hypothetical protein